MNSFRFFMPTEVFFGQDCIEKNKDVLRSIGSKALIVTGKSSAKKNGAQKDITAALESLGKQWVVFDEIEENPCLETIAKAGEFGLVQGVDFVIGIGGGSPMDSAKAIACLIANPNKGTEILFGDKISHLPVVEIPTTAGTGSETTQYSIITLHEKRTKCSLPQVVFAEVSYLDGKYMNTLSPSNTNNTAVDALTHLIESYLTIKSNIFSEKLVEIGLAYFKECIPAIKAREYSGEIRDKLMLASTIGGIAIAQTGTSLPHAMGYALTYEKDVPHGRANGIVIQAYLELFPNKDKINSILSILGMKSINELGIFFDEALDQREVFTEEDVINYSKALLENKAKLSSFPYPITEADIIDMYRKSLLQ